MRYMNKICDVFRRSWMEFRSAYSHLGLGVALYGLMYHLFRIMGERYYRKLDECVFDRYMAQVRYNETSDWDLIPTNGPIWVFWWQGLGANTDPLVQSCVASIRRHAAGREVVIVDRTNYAQFATVDETVVDKFNRGDISMTHFADVLRLALLVQHGGIWLDATVYLTGDIPTSLCDYPFYSSQSYRRVPEAHWTTYFFACGRGNPLCSLVYQSFVNMYKELNYNPEYFMLDVFLMAVYRRSPDIRHILNNIPINNTERFLLSDQLCRPISTLRLLDGEYINKLTYKRKYKLTADGEESVYAALLKGEI